MVSIDAAVRCRAAAMRSAVARGLEQLVPVVFSVYGRSAWPEPTAPNRAVTPVDAGPQMANQGGVHVAITSEGSESITPLASGTPLAKGASSLCRRERSQPSRNLT
jgi:hypothetical protein